MSKLFHNMLRRAENGCLEFTGVSLRSGGKDSHRYGRITRNGKKMLAHRYAYELEYGVIPDGMCVCHKCDNTLCCNPAHLFLGTQKENIRDAVSKNRMSRVSRPKPKGEQSPTARLTDLQITEIRNRRHSGESVASLAAAYGVHHSYISRLANGNRRRLP